MRSPELQLIEKLEEIKKTITENKFPINSSIIPAEHKKAIFPFIYIKAVDHEQDEELRNAIALIHEGIQMTLTLTQKLIEKAKKAEQVSNEDMEALIISIAESHTQKEAILQIMLQTFHSFLIQYREIIEELCAHYDLVLPEDQSFIVIDCSDTDYDEDAKISLYRLQEMEYTLNQFLTPIEAIEKLHPVKDLPYLRHIQIKDSLANQIERSQAQLFARLTAAMDAAQLKLRTIISANQYTDTMTTTVDFVEQQKKLLVKFEEEVQAITLLINQLQTTSTDHNEQQTVKKNNENVLQELNLKFAQANTRREQYIEIVRSELKLQFELSMGGVEAMPNGYSEAPNSSQQWFSHLGTRDRDKSRFGMIEKLVDELSHEMQRIAVSAGVAFYRHGLTDFVSALEKESRPDNATIMGFENYDRLRILCNRLQTLSKEFEAKVQEITQPRQAIEMSQSPSTTNSSAMFSQQVRAGISNRAESSESLDSDDEAFTLGPIPPGRAQ